MSSQLLLLLLLYLMRNCTTWCGFWYMNDMVIANCSCIREREREREKEIPFWDSLTHCGYTGRRERKHRALFGCNDYPRTIPSFTCGENTPELSLFLALLPRVILVLAFWWGTGLTPIIAIVLAFHSSGVVQSCLAPVVLYWSVNVMTTEMFNNAFKPTQTK